VGININTVLFLFRAKNHHCGESAISVDIFLSAIFYHSGGLKKIVLTLLFATFAAVGEFSL
jgi:hypothetical protein